MIRPRPMMRTLVLIAAIILAALAAAPAPVAAGRRLSEQREVSLAGAPCREAATVDGVAIPGDPYCIACTKVVGAGTDQQAISKSKVTTCTLCEGGVAPGAGGCPAPAPGGGGGDNTGVGGGDPGCPLNEYSSGPAACTACPLGSTAPAGSDSIAACTVAAGSVYASGAVVPCPAGSSCSGGSVTGEGAISTPCAPGSSTDGLTGASSCTSCALNSYASAAGSPACDACPTGATTASTGSTSLGDCTVAAGSVYASGAVVPCPAGSSCSGGSVTGAGAISTPCAAAASTDGLTGAATCTPCAAGSSTNGATGAASCSPCAANSSTGAAGTAACAACPPPSTTKGATGATACVADGILASYYKTAYIEALPDFSALTPIPSLPPTVPSLNFFNMYDSFAYSGVAELVAAVFTGDLYIPTAGAWTLFLNSDDGSKMRVDGALVVDHDGLHATSEKASAAVQLSAGRHSVRVEFFEAGGYATLIASWKGPGTAKQVIPASAWGH